MRSAISFTVISSQPYSILTPIHDLVVLLIETLLNFREKGLDPVSKLLWRRRLCCTHMAGRGIRVLKIGMRLTLPRCCGQVSDARDSSETITLALTPTPPPLSCDTYYKNTPLLPTASVCQSAPIRPQEQSVLTSFVNVVAPEIC